MVACAGFTDVFLQYLREYNPEDPDHIARKDRLCELPSGPKLLLDAFDCILARVSLTFSIYFFGQIY
jgi:hypothetical protein